MPYVPPGSNTVQPIAVPISKTHQIVVESLSPPNNAHTTSIDSSFGDREEVHTPRALVLTSSIPRVISVSDHLDEEANQDVSDRAIDAMTTALSTTSLSISSDASTPPLEHSASGRSTSGSMHQPSPASSSVISLPAQRDDYTHGQTQESVFMSDDEGTHHHIENADINDADASHASQDGSIIKPDMSESQEETNKKAGEARSKTAVVEVQVGATVMDALALYTEGIYAYTHSLYIQAKLSSSRAERRRQSITTREQFGPKPSGMEKMAAKKALARRLNG